MALLACCCRVQHHCLLFIVIVIVIVIGIGVGIGIVIGGWYSIEICEDARGTLQVEQWPRYGGRMMH